MKKRHHFVPRGYLARFAAPEGDIWTYDTEANSLRSSPPENTGFEKYLYSRTLPDGKRSDELENLIETLETPAFPVLDKLERGEPLNADEAETLGNFVAIMFVRTDAFRQKYAEMAMSLAQVEMYAAATHPGAFAAMRSKIEKEKGRALSTDEAESFKNAMIDPSQFEIHVDKEWSLKALSFFNSAAPIFSKMNWSSLLTPTDRFFITSDAPVVHGVPTEHANRFYGGGLADRHIEVTFPISAKTCLLGTWKAGLPQSFPLAAEGVKMINRQQAVHSRRFLFAPIRDSGIAKLGQKYKDIGEGIAVSGMGPKERAPVKLVRASYRGSD
ncbi:conserved hypothetical protein [Oceanicaulis sp. 350]|nr:conserved hypothetical protein [Oceanicaulis sp. 350]